MSKIYEVFLDKEKIGTTALDKADAPMGVIFGKLNFLSITLGYYFFKEYCLKHNLGFTDYPEDKLIATRGIPDLVVINENGIEIKGLATSVNGMDNDEFEISIEGVAYPFYEQEFPHHIEAYNNLFK